MLISRDGEYVAYAIDPGLIQRELFGVTRDQPDVTIKLNGAIDALTRVDDVEFIC